MKTCPLRWRIFSAPKAMTSIPCPGELLTGHNDSSIVKAACHEDRLLLTQDLDFADVRTYKPVTHPGIILIRLRDSSRRRLIERMQQLLSSESIESWKKCFVVISDHKLRIRRP
jgi:predicted nuclease of predicted toxin-antitoxin system